MSDFDNTIGLLLHARIVVGAEADDAINVTITLVDRLNGTPVTEVVALPWYLSSEADGTAVSTAPDSGAAISGTSSGALVEWTANISGLLITNANGQANVALTHSTTGTFYLVLTMPDGKQIISGAITFA